MTREEMIAEAERLEAEAKSLLNGEIELEPDDEDYLSNNEPMECDEPGKYSYPPPAPPSDKRTIHLAKNPERRCTAHRKNGEQCRKWAIYGTTVCRSHGGAAPQVREKAKQRLLEASPRLAERLIGLAENDLADGTKVGAYVQVQAINSVLDRAGVVEQKQVDVTVSTPFDQMLTELVSGSRADYRRSIGHPDPEPESLAIEQSTHPRPGGVRAALPYVIDGELADDDVRDQADSNAGDSSQPLAGQPWPPAYQDGTQTLTNGALPRNAVAGGYLPAEDAQEVAQNANRHNRAQLRRR
ncbi:hypothetical protein [Mycolicibacterium fortuitum]|uniref:hypothetical protein n=1 Tax=Mycolicibacterium fortuitum TaxID=1766 RepID=UPI000B1E016A|nr:hypothetical protein [Mycolicibacterium fortuitum]